MKSFRRVLLATDFSQASRQAFEEAIELSKDNGAELLIVHAYRPPNLLPTETIGIRTPARPCEAAPGG